MVRVGIGGPVGSGKTLLIERLVPLLAGRGHSVAVVTNDIFTHEDELHVRTALGGVLEGSRIVGVETGACPHTAVREDPSMNLAALEELDARHPDLALVFVESGGDNLTLTFSPELVDLYVYVVDVAGGDKIPRKRGPGLIEADLLVINKADLAAHVGADLGVMERDALAVRDGRPLLYTDCRRGLGVSGVARWVEAAVERPAARAWAGGRAADRHGHDHRHEHG